MTMGPKKSKSKKKMGRPPIPSPKKYLVVLRVTADEKKMLTKKAKAAGMSLSAYIMAPHRKEKE